MPRKPPDELTQDEIKLLVSAAKMLAALQTYLAALPPQDEMLYWDKNIRKELTMVNVVYGSGKSPCCHPILQMMGHRWTAAERNNTLPDWAGLSLEAVFQSCNQQAGHAPEWHVDLFSHDLTHYLHDIPARKQWWNIHPALANPEEDVDMDEPVHEPSPAPPSPLIPPASQKHTAKGKGQAAPQTMEECCPPRSRHKRGTRCSTTLPDSDVPGDMPSEGDADKDAPTYPLLPQAPPRVDVEGPSPPQPTEDAPKKPMVAIGDVWYLQGEELPTMHLSDERKPGHRCLPILRHLEVALPSPPLWARMIYDVVNTLGTSEKLLVLHLGIREFQNAWIPSSMRSTYQRDFSWPFAISLALTPVTIRDVLFAVCVAQAAGGNVTLYQSVASFKQAHNVHMEISPIIEDIQGHPDKEMTH
ncbi:hypothetical protein EI94DRAFT_1705225 [Lactarius quietus]|nr:hypothetical protein EI94DRAFT_1705225 [Lactarius quietus]